jgi:hypothetical protein
MNYDKMSRERRMAQFREEEAGPSGGLILTLLIGLALVLAIGVTDFIFGRDTVVNFLASFF